MGCGMSRCSKRTKVWDVGISFVALDSSAPTVEQQLFAGVTQFGHLLAHINGQDSIK